MSFSRGVITLLVSACIAAAQTNTLTCGGVSTLNNGNTNFPFVAQVNSGACDNRWSGVACHPTTTNPTNRQIMIGGATSAQSGNKTEYCLVNGHFGNASPTSGSITAQSGTPNWGRARVCNTSTLMVPATGNYSWDWVESVTRIFEFEITSHRSYTISVGQVSPNGVNAAAQLEWAFHAPGTNSSWVSRSSRIVEQAIDTSYSAVLTPGWYCVTVFSDAFNASVDHGFFSVGVTIDPNPPIGMPVASPSLISECSPTTTVAINGPGIVPSTIVQVNGSVVGVTPGFGSVLVSLHATLLDDASMDPVITLDNPAPGGGWTSITINVVPQPLPVIATSAPSSVLRGSGSQTLTLFGSGFSTTTVAYVNGSPRSTAFISSSAVNVVLQSADLLAQGCLPVQVDDPCSGLSNVYCLPIICPVPATSTLVPASAREGSAGFTLVVNGSSFCPSSQVVFDGSPIATTFVSTTRLEALIDASWLTLARSVSVAVSTPPPGGGLSTALSFTVRLPYPGTETQHFELATGVNGAPTTGPGQTRKSAQAFDSLVLQLTSSSGQCVGDPILLFVSLVDLANYVPPFAAYPNIWVAGPYPTVNLYEPILFGAPAVLPPGSASRAFNVPLGLAPTTMLIQGLCSSAAGVAIPNVVVTNAHEISIL